MLQEKLNKMLNRKVTARKPKVAVAVSGGIDSMALALLAAAWTKDVTALTVDHGIRKEAAEEAKQVAKWMKKLKIKHHILTNKKEKPKSDVMNYAREVRYSLLTDWCKKNKIDALLVAHNLEDQAETVLMRMERGSGVDGLSGIPPENTINGVRILRPLISISRKDLKKFLKEKKQKWIEDPTNKNTKYKRNKTREVLNAITDVEKDVLVKRFADIAGHMQRVKGFLETASDNAFKNSVVVEEKRFLLDGARFRSLHEEIALRLLTDLLVKAGKKGERPRFDNLKNLYENLMREDFKAATLAGCRVFASIKKRENGKIIFISEG